MEWSLRRITSSGKFIPEIDGLRFIAITSVVIYHLSGFLAQKDNNAYVDSVDYSFLVSLLAHGNLGVSLFFVISGFVLGIPFAKAAFQLSEPVNLKAYYLRRLTRLEPPYIIVLTVMFFGAIYIAKTVALHDGIVSYLSSLLYVHNFIYGREVFPLLNGVAWSLEIEVQFYILAPLMGCLFYIRLGLKRRMTLAGLILLFIIYNCYILLPFRSLLEYFQFFLLGFLLADLYVCKKRIMPKTRFDDLLGLCCFLGLWIFDKKEFAGVSEKIAFDIAQLISVFFFYYYVLCQGALKFLPAKMITNIGGMCYSIYLLHFIVISLFGNVLMQYCFSELQAINISIYIIILLLLVMAISTAFFLLIERPCMKKRWYKDFIK